ncbi:unnamed protein product [marine sediment metagenome]|uniref:Uncharacterized protein n=1 Tax=marine sediment metagenome TaxID=412755 RepID=X1IZI3_9ZZZZ
MIGSSEILDRIREAMPHKDMKYGDYYTRLQFDKIWKAIESCEAELASPS